MSCSGEGSDNSSRADLGATNAGLARLLGLDAAVVSRRYESGKARMSESQAARRLMNDSWRSWSKQGDERRIANCMPDPVWWERSALRRRAMFIGLSWERSALRRRAMCSLKWSQPYCSLET